MKTNTELEETIKELRLKIHRLQSNLTKKSKKLEELRYNKKLNEQNHRIRVICKDKNKGILLKINEIYELTLK